MALAVYCRENSEEKIFTSNASSWWGQPLAKIKIYMNPGEYLLANTETIILETWIGWPDRIRIKIIIFKTSNFFQPEKDAEKIRIHHIKLT